MTLNTFESLQQHVAKNLSEPLTYSTAFSGIDAPGTALHVLSELLGPGLPNDRRPNHLWAIEWLGASKMELSGMPGAGRPSCLVGDISGLWKPVALTLTYYLHDSMIF